MGYRAAFRNLYSKEGSLVYSIWVERSEVGILPFLKYEGGG